MNKFPHIITLVSLLTLMLSCKVHNNSSTFKTLKIRQDFKYPEVSLCQIFIFEKGKPILDTMADFDGEYKFPVTNDVKKMAFRSIGNYILTLNKSSLIKRDTVFLKRIEILTNSSGTQFDKKAWRKDKKLLVSLVKWNHKAGVDSVSYGYDHPNDFYYYKDLNFLKTN